MLNKSGSKIETCETPNNISSQELHDEFRDSSVRIFMRIS